MSLTTEDKTEIRQIVEEAIEKFAYIVASSFQHVENRFNNIEDRFNAIDKRFDLIDQRFERVDRSFDRLEIKQAEEADRFRDDMRLVKTKLGFR